MSCVVVNSQSQVQSRLPSLPQTLPKTQADWNAVLATFNQWGQILQQASHAPNVIPSQFQTFTVSAATAVIAALSAVNCTPSVDTGQQYYGAASLKVAISATGATLAFAGNPISIAPASRWFASFQIYAPSGCTGQLTVKTSAGHSVSESFTVPVLAEWQQVWGLVDLRQYADTQATWQFTFTSTATVWIDGMQMNAVGSPIGVLPKFAGTQMVTGTLAYQSNLDGVPDGSTFVRLLASHAAGNAAYNFKGIWNSATTYAIADEVVYGPTYWLAISASTNSAPPSAHWQAVGTYGGFQGAWSSVTAYAAGAEVTYTGNFWICVTANTNSAPSASNANWQIAGPTSLDSVADGSIFLRSTFMSSAQNILDNPGFEADSNLPPAGWVNGSSVPAGSINNATLSYDTTTPYSGSRSLVISSSATNSGVGYAKKFSVNAGQTYYWRFAGKNITGSGNMFIKDSAGGGVFPGITSTSWALYSGTYTPAAGATWISVGWFAAAGSTFEIDDVYLVRVNNMDSEVLDGSNYLRMPAPPSASASLTGGTLTQTGTGAQFTVSACTYYIGNLTMNVNAGTVNPGTYNTFYVYFDSPNYAGGTIPFQVTTDPTVLGQYPWRFYVGKITTSPSGGGGGGGGGGPCFTGDVRIKTAAGYRRFDELPQEFEIENLTGRHCARLLVHPKSIEPMRRMGDGLVTVGHLIRVGDGWVPAGQIFHEKAPTVHRTVYNMHVLSDSPEDHHYLLENGLTAHNIKP